MFVSLIKYISRDFLGTPVFTKTMQTIPEKKPNRDAFLNAFLLLVILQKSSSTPRHFTEMYYTPGNSQTKKEYPRKFRMNFS